MHKLLINYFFKQVLELDHNEISHLDKRAIEKLNQTNPNTTITLHNNPWQCDCETKELLNFIQARFSKVVICNLKQASNNSTVKYYAHYPTIYELFCFRYPTYTISLVLHPANRSLISPLMICAEYQ